MMMSLVLKATVILLLGLASARAARHCRASLRHAILLATFAMVAVLPAAMLALPERSIDVPLAGPVQNVLTGPAATIGRSIPSPATQPSAQLAAAPRATAGPGAARLQTAVAFVWLLGTLVCLAPVAIGIWRVRWLRRTALPSREMHPLLDAVARATSLRMPVEIAVHEAVPAPIACGVQRSLIVLPPDAPNWDPDALRRALVHELEHIRRRDWLTQLFSRSVCAFFWFNPLSWIAHRQLALFAEHACDDAVLADAEDTTYADQLLTLARRLSARPRLVEVGMAQRSDLSARVTAVLDTTRARGRSGLRRTIPIALAALVLIVTLGPLHLRAAEARVGVNGESVDGTQSRQPRRDRASRLDRDLVEAAGAGDLDDVRALLDEGAHVNAVVEGDGSPLIAAAREGHLDIVRLLLDRGADVNLSVPGDGSALIMAAREGHLDVVQVLLDRGADVDQIVEDDENALIQASGAGALEVVKLLVARGANVNASVTVDRTYDARLRRDGGEPASYTATRREVRTPLNMAERGGHRTVVEFLRSSGAIQ